MPLERSLEQHFNAKSICTLLLELPENKGSS